MPFIPNLSNAGLNQAVGAFANGLASASHYHALLHNAMVFTSTLRSRGVSFRAATSGAPAGTSVSDFFRGARSGLLTEIELPLNPTTIRWKQPKRFTKMDTREGSTTMHFTNSKGQNEDLLGLEFTVNTGNTDRRGDIDVGDGTVGVGAEQKLVIFHNMLLLSHEPQYLPDGTENAVFISYISPLFPKAIEFTGFFNEVPSFEEVGRKPHAREYTFGFTVNDCSPPLSEVLDLILQTTENVTLGPNPTGNIFGPNTVPFVP